MTDSYLMTVIDNLYLILTHTVQMTHTPLTKQFEPFVYKPDHLIKLSLKLDLVSNLQYLVVIPSFQREAFHLEVFFSHAPRPTNTRTPLYSIPDTRIGITPGPTPHPLDYHISKK